MCAAYKCGLNEIGLKRAKVELGEVETDRESAVQSLREWVLQQSDWLHSHTGTHFLLSFLRHSKFSQNAAKERLIEFWKGRVAYSDIYRNIDTRSDAMDACLKSGVIVRLPKVDKDDGCQTVLLRFGQVNLKEYKADPSKYKNLMICVAAVFDVLLTEDMNQVCGSTGLIDCTGHTIEHAMYLSSRYQDVWQYFFKTIPVRHKSIIFYNIGNVLDLVYTLLKKLLPKKLQERVSVHSSLKTVYDTMDMSTLPLEYLPDGYEGPNSGPLSEIIENFAKYMQSDAVRDHVLKLSSGEYYCDINKRPADVIPTQSFRSLTV